ncbi:hypothetical protein F383_30544 [Gossypium arboreum]|uniref:Uncharacterized protein n=1 Tax=Gossypium arboreum TaxID=29729 RepID=A0A0B0MYI2_GOSAR|nr:hypothetical protein F383_30544 [Gossypium arboreum]
MLLPRLAHYKIEKLLHPFRLRPFFLRFIVDISFSFYVRSVIY